MRLVRDENGQFKTEEQVPDDSTLAVRLAVCSVGASVSLLANYGALNRFFYCIVNL